MKLCTAAEMMEVDRQAIVERGIPGAVLMENAGRACCRHFNEFFADLFPGPVLVVAGRGNNGGDGYVMARILNDQGWQVETLVLAEADKITGDAAIMLEVMRNLELPLTFATESDLLRRTVTECGPRVIVDAIFGTGLNSDVRGLQAEAITLINTSAAQVFSVDIPSGVDGSNGRICGMAVQADLTVTFDQAKIGHGSQPGASRAGQLEVVDIGIPRRGRKENAGQIELVDAAAACELAPVRPGQGHKGTFGHLLIVAGSPGKTGAAALAGHAAVRSGCGLVTTGVPAALHDIIEVKLTEAMSYPLADDGGYLSPVAFDQITALLDGRQALALGPGLGAAVGLADLVGRLVETCNVPLVIDADGLNLLAGQLVRLQEKATGQVVLTPHPGEMARLTGLSVREIEANRFEIARNFAAEHGVVLLLKGARTLVAAPDGRVNINSSGNDGLASGGSGDVLTGLIGGLLAQGLEPFRAASLGAWLHGRSAELVAETQGTAGMAASDLLLRLPLARRELVSTTH
ncbi:MAG: bifunctional ADP-dependent NAD(P)H-hydrate dehydratase/NAD(P)H-hydrate epimerase [Desulfuromonas sp.]|nr:MAG: bifunctional ADP-dependent NAD(P)H-hydrate dehydratase/NAD(P)H-hydrate epimerase [Desulfuromonas sp.]